MSISKTNVPFDPATPDHERLRELIRQIHDKSSPSSERDLAKNELLLAHENFIRYKVLGLTDGRIGINDRLTEQFDSAFIHLKERASQIAEAVKVHDVSLLTAIAVRLEGWAKDKIRRSDGKTLKRGKGRKKEPVTALEVIQGGVLPPDEEVMRQQTLAQIRADIRSAIAEMDDLEVAVLLSYFGFDGPELSMREVADLQGVSLAEANNALRRVRYKLRQWLREHDPHKSDE